MTDCYYCSNTQVHIVPANYKRRTSLSAIPDIHHHPLLTSLCILSPTLGRANSFFAFSLLGVLLLVVYSSHFGRCPKDTARGGATRMVVNIIRIAALIQ